VNLDLAASFAHSGSAAVDAKDQGRGDITAGGGFKLPQWVTLAVLGVVLLLGVGWILHRH
jgi:hypothetical protein